MRQVLLCHPDTPAIAVRSVEAELSMAGDEIVLSFRATPGDGLTLPAVAEPARTDALWRHTCFELFVSEPDSDAYCEFNLSPSTQWAAYRFSGYRAGMTALEVPAIPRIETAWQGNAFILTADLRLPVRRRPLRIGLSAVIEESEGTKSYWALRHPPGVPDFHHPDSFALERPVL
ncbi:DOMON-like domain-containing protein [Allosphingosinicella indica]|uniref:DOMON-like domain-containing protein n=1 Tax=Allosphingosinicella indica TaxID=941907 RepID=A0A1X7H308_9SPHN|nr:DOMON-like domain-containing protein [Allosphingosinicella indica]SMF78728.1 hypothetical protein SAMN06295910_2744 [Allosphingosinicella indica]